MPLTGNLKEFDLVSLIQILSGKFSTGKLIVNKPFKKGILYFKDGRVINGEVGKLKGMSAFLELFTWDDGNFEFVEETNIDVPVAISMSLKEFLLIKLPKIYASLISSFFWRISSSFCNTSTLPSSLNL